MQGQKIVGLYSPTDIEYSPTGETKDGVTRLTSVKHPRLHIYEPDQGKWNGHHIIVCPGGGYKILAIDKEGTEIAEWLTSLGYKAYVLEYTVPDNKSKAFEDLAHTIHKIRTLSDFGKDSKLGVIGFSAGGHLATTVSTKPDISLYEPTDGISEKPDFAVLIYPAYLDKGENQSLSPEVPLTEMTIPMFIFATADDPYAYSSVVLAEALQINKTSVEFHLLPEGGHGYGLRSGRAATTWPILCAEWLKIQNP
ncbi:alpha/beta hydrolase [Portibacter lacus]|uniref:Xylanase n=1 Tax=Portibacter lacus TaxID=1099794 RepID=A0AA37WGW9_9BACT|nr:alpha/beta hydrolase [Portibacter lacus]GLR18659.1 xylanase [Portibacter lacus]